MNNYSRLQQLLHIFALSSKFIRTVTFDLENLLTRPNHKIDNHVFISGLARSGSTILLNAIFKSNKFSSLLYKDMPFILAPNLWSMLSPINNNISSVERSHGDGIMISLNSPEAFEEVFWKTIGDKSVDSEEKFKSYVNLINHKYQQHRYLSKNNQNIRRISLINNIFPKSKILIPFRNPIQQANSLLNQHKKFIKASKKDKFVSDYMNLIGHTEFGPKYIPLYRNQIKFDNDMELNHWIEQWYLVYKNSLSAFELNNSVKFICYEELCKSKKYWSNILDILDIEFYDFEFKESKTEVFLESNNNISNKALDLYSQLS